MSEQVPEPNQGGPAARGTAAPGSGAWGLTTGWSRPELLAVAALLLVVVSGTAWLAWDRLGGWGGTAGAASDAATGGRAAGPAPGPGASGGGAGAPDAGGANAVTAGQPGADGAAGEKAASAAETVVHVAGAVLHPGVYTVPAGSRIVDAITAAGGQRPDGRSDLLNLATVLVDGDKVYVPSQREVDSAAQGSGSGGEWTAPGQGGKVDVNHADLQALETLPGVGPSLAASILRYRQEHGPFRKVEDLEKVPGIGPSKLAALRDQVVLR